MDTMLQIIKAFFSVLGKALQIIFGLLFLVWLLWFVVIDSSDIWIGWINPASETWIGHACRSASETWIGHACRAVVEWTISGLLSCVFVLFFLMFVAGGFVAGYEGLTRKEVPEGVGSGCFLGVFVSAILVWKFVLVPQFFPFLNGTKDSDTWTGHVYPDKNNLSVSRKIGEYPSLEKCREVAQAKIAAAGWRNADYECGLNCKPMFPEIPDSVLVCEENSR